jgi:hypothetical protein
MRRQAVIGALLLIGLGIALGATVFRADIAQATGLAQGGKSASPAARSVTIHLVEKSAGFNFIDNPPRQGFNSPPLIGDSLALTSNLLTRGGAHAGTLEATCTVTRGGVHTRGACYGVFALKGGQIAGITLLPPTNVTHVAVVGGTGVYEGVTGSVISVSRGENSPFADDTVHLIWP